MNSLSAFALLAAVLTVVPAQPVAVDTGVILATVPEGATLLYYADPRCAPQTLTPEIPPLALRDCLQHKARFAVLRIAERDRLVIGTSSPCYPLYGIERTNCLDVAARYLPRVSYGLSPRWTLGMLNGEAYEGCAAGISGDPIFVSLAQPERSLALVAWESANELVWKTYDRQDLTSRMPDGSVADLAPAPGAVITEATNDALRACGVQ